MKEVIQLDPHPLLSDYIESYNLRRITVQHATEFPSNKQYVINLYLKGNQQIIDIDTHTDINPEQKAILIGHQNKHNWNIIFDSSCEMLSVQFNPTGMHFLFGINMAATLNRALLLAEVAGKEIVELETQLRGISQTADYKSLLDYFFMQILSENRIEKSSLFTHFSAFCLKPTSVSLLAKSVCLSQRQMNRKFAEVVGTSPKAYQRKYRFSQLMLQSIAANKVNWTDASYAHEFYDQAHMIKDFKHFTSLPPKKYFKDFNPILPITY